MEAIYTIGHSNRAFSEFLEKLQESEIQVVVDVRTFPRSRFCPWFNEKRLATELSEAGVTYLFKGKNLGGRGENEAYEETIDELVTQANSGKRICVMCSEGDYKACHRWNVLEPSFVSRGIEVRHILYEKKS